MQHDAWFFIGIFAFIFLVWLATGGPTHPLAFSGPRLSLPGVLGGGTYISLPQAPQIGGGGVSLPGSTNEGGFSQTPASPNGSDFGPPSTYRGAVSLTHYVSGAGGDPGNEYVELSVRQNASAPVTITGWTLESDASGKAAVIPGGTAVPTSGVVNAAEPITLRPGDRAIIISGSSPIGASFRENKCIGYFGAFQSFSPPLPQNCPLPSEELKTRYGPDYLRDASCVDYVATRRRCDVTLSPPPTLSGACQNFLASSLNYNGCVNAHQGDSDFRGTVWRVYLGRTTPLWRTRHELVKLFDASGKTVDVFMY